MKIFLNDHCSNQNKLTHQCSPLPLQPGGQQKRDALLPLPYRSKGQHESLPRNKHRLLLCWKLQSESPGPNRFYYDEGWQYKT